jgi:hypothetical protein
MGEGETEKACKRKLRESQEESELQRWIRTGGDRDKRGLKSQGHGPVIGHVLHVFSTAVGDSAPRRQLLAICSRFAFLRFEIC